MGVMVREMADAEPPYLELPPARAILLIMTKGMPPYKDASKWSSNLKDFCDKCLAHDPEKRSLSNSLLNVRASNSLSVLNLHTASLPEHYVRSEGDESAH